MRQLITWSSDLNVSHIGFYTSLLSQQKLQVINWDIISLFEGRAHSNYLISRLWPHHSKGHLIQATDANRSANKSTSNIFLGSNQWIDMDKRKASDPHDKRADTIWIKLPRLMIGCCCQHAVWGRSRTLERSAICSSDWQLDLKLENLTSNLTAWAAPISHMTAAKRSNINCSQSSFNIIWKGVFLLWPKWDCELIWNWISVQSNSSFFLYCMWSSRWCSDVYSKVYSKWCYHAL